MPNIYGKYSLTELAQELKVTAAFINRIQRVTGIGGQVGTKGQATLFNESDIHIFRRIKFLRKMDYSFQEIKETWDLESKLFESHKQFNSQKIEVDKKEMPFIIHNGKLYIQKSFEQIKGNKKAKAYFEEISKLGNIAKGIKERYDSFKEEAKEMDKIVIELVPLEWDEILKGTAYNLLEISKISVDK
jgi:DNA-binding transcriptional MerR regulator